MIHRAGQQDSRGAKSYGFDRLVMRSIAQEMAGALAEIFSLPEEAELVTGGRSKNEGVCDT